MRTEYFVISAIWSFVMCLSLASILWGRVCGETDPAINGLFQIFSAIGMLWMPLAIVRATAEFDSWKAEETGSKLSIVTALGQPLWYALWWLVPVVVLRFNSHLLGLPTGGWITGIEVLYLSLLCVANCHEILRGRGTSKQA
jgi:hypothetical protein